MTVGTTKFYYDTRLGAVPKPVFGDPRECLMRVPDDILKCTAFLCVDTGDGYKPGGTAFFVMVPSEIAPEWIYTYLVTAKHCVLEAEKYGQVFVRVNGRDGNLKLVRIGVPWTFPADPAVDLAVLPIGLQYDEVDVRLLDHKLIATDETIEQHAIGIGDDVMVAGLFTRRYGDKKNIPIVRVGNIAAMPDEPLSDSRTGPFHAYLLEARSIGGLSGSPVFVHLPFYRPRKDNRMFVGSPYLFLIGVIRGHWDHEEEKFTMQTDFMKELEQVNMGIAIATPSQELHKILFSEEFVAERKRMDAERIKRNDAKNDSTFGESQKTPKGFSIPVPAKNDIENALKIASRKK